MSLTEHPRSTTTQVSLNDMEIKKIYIHEQICVICIYFVLFSNKKSAELNDLLSECMSQHIIYKTKTLHLKKNVQTHKAL